MPLKSLAPRIFGKIVDRYGNMFSVVKDALPKAGIKMTFNSYMSICFFTAMIAFVTTIVPLVLALQIVGISLIQKIIYCIFVPIIVAIIVFSVTVMYPVQAVAKRRKNIDANLPFALTHMGSIAESGIPPYVIFKLLSEFEEYGEISKEMKKIVRNIDVFGMDVTTAVKEVAKRTPSDQFKQALLGFVTTTESGGDIKLYLKNTGEQALFNWKMKREKFLQQLSAYAEFYTGIVIAAPLFIVSLFAVMGMIQPTIMGFGILELTKISIYFVIPAINIGFLLFLRGMEVEM